MLHTFVSNFTVCGDNKFPKNQKNKRNKNGQWSCASLENAYEMYWKIIFFLVVFWGDLFIN